MGWKGESRRHSLARKGIATSGIPKISTSFRYTDANADRVVKGKISPIFELDLSDYNLPFIVNLHENPEYHDRRKGKAYEVIVMNVDKYLEACVQGSRDGEIYIEQDKIKRIEKGVAKGNKLPMPYLEYSAFYSEHADKMKASFGQEGIHRAVVSKSMGHNWIPVVVIYPSEVDNFEIAKDKMSWTVSRSIDMSKVRTEEERRKEYEKKHGEHWYL